MGASNYHLVAILHFHDLAAIQAAFASADVTSVCACRVPRTPQSRPPDLLTRRERKYPAVWG
jgi:hypothetical protein